MLRNEFDEDLSVRHKANLKNDFSVLVYRYRYTCNYNALHLRMLSLKTASRLRLTANYNHLCIAL